MPDTSSELAPTTKANSTQRFEWNNIEAVNAQLREPSLDSQWRFESALGSVDINQYDNEILSGRIEFFELIDDLKLLIMDCHWKQDQVFVTRDNDWIRFNFSLSISMDMAVSQENTISALSPSWRVINNPPDADILEHVKANTNSVWATLCCKPALLEKITGLEQENMPDLLQTALNGYEFDCFHRYFSFSQDINAMTNDLIHSELSGAMRIALMNTKCIEILCKSINEIQKLRLKPSVVKLSDSDINCIVKAHDILLDNLQAPPTIAKLAETIGVNRNKLFYGFKEVYDLSISEFIQDKKLELAYQLLTQSELAIIEVANLAGFKHQCNFSTAIKRKFATSPSKIRAGSSTDLDICNIKG
jgi:AraC-like DNA-binding protein